MLKQKGWWSVLNANAGYIMLAVAYLRLTNWKKLSIGAQNRLRDLSACHGLVQIMRIINALI